MPFCFYKQLVFINLKGTLQSQYKDTVKMRLCSVGQTNSNQTTLLSPTLSPTLFNPSKVLLIFIYYFVTNTYAHY